MVVVAVLWVLFAPGSGVLALYKKRQELLNLQAKTAQLEQENAKLQKDIDRLQNDPRYLEEVARRDYGLLRTNERVYDFSPKKKEEKED